MGMCRRGQKGVGVLGVQRSIVLVLPFGVPRSPLRPYADTLPPAPTGFLNTTIE
jgi:hypothetical protein